MRTRNGIHDSSKRIVETISFQIATSHVDHAALVRQMLVDYHEAPWCELSILLSALRALAFTHQVSHWTASGDPFYGDHQLFQRLYDGVNTEVDAVAEKAVGMGGAVMIHPMHQANHESLFVAMMCSSGTSLPTSGQLAHRSYEAEMHFMGVFDSLVERMKSHGTWTTGVENMVGDISDKHESNIYLLKQRISG